MIVLLLPLAIYIGCYFLCKNMCSTNHYNRERDEWKVRNKGT